MTCPELHKNIQSYLDGTLPAEQEEALVNTLLEDTQARSLYMRYAEIDTLLADAHEGTEHRTFRAQRRPDPAGFQRLLLGHHQRMTSW